MSETINTREALEPIFGGTFYVVDQWVLDREDWSVEGRDYLGNYQVSMTTDREQADIFVLNNVSGSADYGIDQSNYRSLKRDFPDVFGEYQGGLYLPLDGEISPLLANVLVGLDDYIIYDEMDHSALVTEAETEAWDDYLLGEVRTDLLRRHGIDTQEIYEVGESVPVRHWSTEMTSVVASLDVDADRLKEIVWQALSDGGYSYSYEDGYSGSDWDHLLKTVGGRLTEPAMA